MSWFTSLFSSPQPNDLTHENAALKQRNDILDQSGQRLSRENTELRQHLASYAVALRNLTDENTELKQRINYTSRPTSAPQLYNDGRARSVQQPSQVRSTTQNAQQLQSAVPVGVQRQQMYQQIVSLHADNSRLRSQIQSQRSEISQLEQDNAELKEENDDTMILHYEADVFSYLRDHLIEQYFELNGAFRDGKELMYFAFGQSSKSLKHSKIKHRHDEAHAY